MIDRLQYDNVPLGFNEKDVISKIKNEAISFLRLDVYYFKQLAMRAGFYLGGKVRFLADTEALILLILIIFLFKRTPGSLFH
ncbi:hypothetical protein BKP45_01170 [Anaerobacillus alkalidiazotrophicus]|uniref:Uncharacterized protein n=1 Tax=Anaerobacillus alkalidiazotrophicus TaxID=472963 RepID=A0A1S2M9Y2_9BACI|nr:hypothetical protein BKP45_01170 [Anaerobacillus alkalidiazotrophicus]